MISVVIPCYNGGKFLSSALDSVEAQKLDSLQVIIIDDGSTDNTLEIAQTYAKSSSLQVNVITHQNKENLGIGATYRLGLQNANQRYLAFLEQDDQWAPNYLSQKINILNKYPDVGLVFSNIQICQEDGKRLGFCDRKVSKPLPVNEPFSSFSMLREGNFIRTFSDIFVRRSLVKPEYILSDPEGFQDWMFLLIISNLASFFYCTSTFIFWRRWDGSFNSQQILGSNYQKLRRKAVNNALTIKKRIERGHTVLKNKKSIDIPIWSDLFRKLV